MIRSLCAAASVLACLSSAALAGPAVISSCTALAYGPYPCLVEGLPTEPSYTSITVVFNLSNRDVPHYLIKVRKNGGQFEVSESGRNGWTYLGVWRAKSTVPDYICVEPVPGGTSAAQDVCMYFKL